MKSIDIVSKIVAREGEAKASPSKGIQSINLSDYLLKSVWDKVFEIRTDSQGTEYIFGKLPVVTQSGITMYSGDGVDVPSLASGLPFDGRTIWYNPDTQQIEVIGGTGGGSGEGVSNFWDLNNIPSWITNSKPKYTYSEIEGTPDLSGYATQSWVENKKYLTSITSAMVTSALGFTPFNSASFTKANIKSALGISDWALASSKPSYTTSEVTEGTNLYFTNARAVSALTETLKAYVTLGGTQRITGEKNFTGGLKVNGSPIYYNTEKKYWKLEGDLLVTGGVTMYGSDSSFTPSTIMDALLYDDTTLGINSNGQLYVKGGTSGGGLDITALQNYLTSNSYLNVTSGDNRYLKLSGGDLSGNIFINTYASNKTAQSYIRFNKGTEYFGMGTSASNVSVFSLGTVNDDNTWKKEAIQFYDNGIVNFLKPPTVDSNIVLHAGNYSSYALPLSGGEISSTSVSPFAINTSSRTIELRLKSNSSIKAYIGWNVTDGVFLQEGESTAYIGVQLNKTPYYFNGTRYTLWHEGNFTPSNYLPLSGGTITSASPVSVTLNANNDGQTALFLQSKGTNKTYVGWDKYRGTCLYDFSSDSHFGILNGIPRFNSNTIWHSGNDGDGSGLDADLLDGQEGSWYRQNVISFGRVNYTSSLVHDANVAIDGMLYNYGSDTYWRNTPDMSYGQILTLKSVGNNDLMGQLAWDIRHGESDTTRYLWWRAIQSESTISNAKWHQIAFTDSNVASATYSPNSSKLYSTDNIYSYGSANPYYGYLTFNQTYGEWDFKVYPNTPEYIHVYSSDKLRTARSIWGQSFDGTGNVSGNLTLENNYEIVTKNISGSISSTLYRTKSNNLSIGEGIAKESNDTYISGYNLFLRYGTGLTNGISLISSGNVGIGTTSPSSKLHVSGDILGDSICVNNTDGSGNGISLYKGTASINFVTTYGIWFGVTSTFGTHGNVNGDWATYFSMSNDSGRGWIFRRSDNVRVASISKDGNMLVNGGVTMYSDQRKKTILNHVELSLKQIADAPLIEHYYNSDESKTTHVGSIAQYWANMNDWFCKLDSEGFYTMEIQNAALASAISIARELDRYETKTDKAIKKLKKRICELEEEVERLKAS